MEKKFFYTAPKPVRCGMCSAGLPDGVSCAAMRFYPSVYGEKERMVE